MQFLLSITKEFRFEAAHSLPHHKGLCKNIHGHSYILYITLTGPVKENNGESDEGMIMDFGELKTIVKEKVLNYYDHAFVMGENQKGFTLPNGQKIRLIKNTPTCENILLDIYHSIKDSFAGSIKIKRIRLHETASSYAELEF